MQVALEIIGAIIVICLIGLGVEKYIEFLKSRTPTNESKNIPNPYIGDKRE